MCGIGGVMMFPKDRYAWEMEYIRTLVELIAIENQSRGKDATGVVTFNNDGVKLFKAPLAAMRFVCTSTYQRFVNDAITYDTHSVLIHTRAGTKGSEQNNDNNHPIESRKYIGVHNGVIYNDDELFDKEKLFRLAEVDSEVIFRMHDKYGDTLDGIKQAAEKLQGGFTYSFASKENRSLLYLVRNSNPVTMAFIPILNIIVFASEKRFLQDAIEQANITLEHEIINCEWFEPKAKTIMVFDTESDTAFEQLCQEGVSFSPSYSPNWNYDFGYDDWVLDETYGWVYNKPNKYVKKNEDTQEEKDNELEEIFKSLTKDNRQRIYDFIEAEKEMAWNMGWSAGRSSLDDTIKHSRSLAYEQGYEDGTEKGYKLGKMYMANEAEKIITSKKTV